MYLFYTFVYSALVSLHSKTLTYGRGYNALIAKSSIFFIISVFSILAAFRTIEMHGHLMYGGIDAHAYKAIYSAVKEQSLIESLGYQPWEYGFSLLFWLSANAGLSYEVFQFIVYFFMLYTIVEISKRMEAGPAKLLCLIAITIGIIDSFNLLRSYLSLFIAIWSLFKITDRKPVSGLIILGVAISIHTTALPLFIMFFYAWLYRRHRKMYLPALFLAITLSAVFANYIMYYLLKGARVGSYLESDVEYFAIGTYLAVISIWAALYVLNKRPTFKSNALFEYAYPMLPTVLIILPVHMVHYMAYRMLFVYINLMYILIPFALYYLSPLRTRGGAMATSAYAVLLFYPVFKIVTFLMRAFNNDLSAQQYQFNLGSVLNAL